MKKPVALLCSFILALSFLQLDCKKDTVSTPTENTPDTTSHNFTFTSYTFGGTGGSSYFKDVAIINDSDIWAVGEIHTADSNYNATHWDGKKWELKQIKVALNGNMIMPYLDGAFAFSATDIWFVGSFPIHGNGSEWTMYHLQNMGIGASVSKGWGIKTNAMFFVGSSGSSGSIVYYNGISWTKQESGTTVDLRDVWGSSDGKTVWVCGYVSNFSQSCLLKFEGSTWKTLWLKLSGSTAPYGDLVLTLWASDKYLYVGAADAVYRSSLTGDNTPQRILTLPAVPHRIRGVADNDITVACDDASIWHYNGSTWKREAASELLKPHYSLAVSPIKIVAVGFDASTINWQATIYSGTK